MTYICEYIKGKLYDNPFFHKSKALPSCSALSKADLKDARFDHTFYVSPPIVYDRVVVLSKIARLEKTISELELIINGGGKETEIYKNINESAAGQDLEVTKRTKASLENLLAKERAKLDSAK